MLTCSLVGTQSIFFVKGPGKSGQAWHQDEVCCFWWMPVPIHNVQIYIPTRDRSLCGAWIAIDDATIENGCMWCELAARTLRVPCLLR
jgi:ectoine hydroxylase-related dioxygenase (phytanoyl-CoA dioxygenase family)